MFAIPMLCVKRKGQRSEESSAPALLSQGGGNRKQLGACWKQQQEARERGSNRAKRAAGAGHRKN